MNGRLSEFDHALRQIYGVDPHILERQNERYQQLLDQFKSKFGKGLTHLFSTPGRTEIGGNHTDHNHGRVLAASVNLDAIAVAAKNKDDRITLYSAGYENAFVINLNRLDPVEKEQGTTDALIRGIAARFKTLGFQIGGFNACISSDVLQGSGLSSSAAIEVLIGSILNGLYNDGAISAEILAMIGQYAENEYFGKPCGLMDQMACAVGGIITIDFENPGAPIVERVTFNFEAQKYRVLVVDTGGNHADLTEDYAAVPAEMKAVANALGAAVIRDIDEEQLFHEMKSLRETVGDRALLRALHFIGDNHRVKAQVAALETGNFEGFLQLVNESGNSSFKWLQNIYTIKNVREQGISLALALTEQFISKTGEGACRVHGGGFAGTIQVFLPEASVADYTQQIEGVMGKGSVVNLKIRPPGTVCLNDLR